MKRRILRRLANALGAFELGRITNAFALLIEADDIQRSR